LHGQHGDGLEVRPSRLVGQEGEAFSRAVAARLQRLEQLRHDTRVHHVLEARSSLINVGSLNAVPMKMSPTGNPNTFPIGTLMIGYRVRGFV